jgi:hypothetical protein
MSLLRSKYAFVGENTLKLLHVLPALHARLSNFLSTFILRTPSVLQTCKLSQSGRSEKLAGQFSGCVLCVLFATTKKCTFHLRTSYFLAHFCTQTTRRYHARRDVRLALVKFSFQFSWFVYPFTVWPHTHFHFHVYGDFTIAGDGLQNVDLCSALRAVEQGMVFIVPHLLWHRASGFPASSEGPPHSVTYYNTQKDADDLRAQFNCSMAKPLWESMGRSNRKLTIFHVKHAKSTSPRVHSNWGIFNRNTF